jgi:hypothetical protein
MRWIGLGFILALVVLAPAANAQPCCAGETLQTPRPIPTEFESWSLSLVCNPAWWLKENQQLLQGLRVQFAAFSEAIGPKHLAVWFAKQGQPDSVDADRSARYCEKFGLLPSEGPHVLVTTTYPDLDQPTLNYYVIKLNGTRAPEISSLLTKLADQLLVQGLRQEELDSERWWRAWQSIFESTRTTVATLMKKVKVTIDTKFFKVEIEGGN